MPFANSAVVRDRQQRVQAMPIDLPPPRFDHQFDGPVLVIDNYDQSISAIGQPCYPWTGAYACAVMLPLPRPTGTCVIFAQHGKLTSELRRHEIGHCNGWPADHSR